MNLANSNFIKNLFKHNNIKCCAEAGISLINLVKPTRFSFGKATKIGGLVYGINVISI